MSDPSIKCRFCGGANCETGDYCRDCGCPVCGYPGALFAGSDGLVRGFCPEPACGWEAAPGAYEAWKARQPKLTTHQMYRALMNLLGADLPPDDEVGGAIYNEGGKR